MTEGVQGVLVPNRSRPRRRPPDFAPSSETPGGYVGQDFDELSRLAVVEKMAR